LSKPATKWELAKIAGATASTPGFAEVDGDGAKRCRPDFDIVAV
jgi:hypothetical protein